MALRGKVVITCAVTGAIHTPSMSPHLPVTAEEIRALREREKISQAVLATFIGVTPGHISKLENAVATAEGSTLAMINVIRRKGLKAVA